MAEEIWTVLKRQHGVISRRQALEAGRSARQIDRLLRVGEWTRIEAGVYRHSMVARSWRGDLVAACLITGGVASHRAAAALHKIGGAVKGIVEVVIHRGCNKTLPWAIIHKSKQFDLFCAVNIDGIPTTPLDRTMLDYSAVVKRDRLDEAIDSLLVADRLSLRELATVRHIHSRRGRDGCGFLAEALDERMGESGVPLSVWSRQVARLLTDHQLPKPVFEHRVYTPIGEFAAQVDLAYPEALVAIELDSVRWHLNRRSFESDAARRNRLTVLGWTVLNFTWAQFRDQSLGLVLTVRQALRPPDHSGH